MLVTTFYEAPFALQDLKQELSEQIKITKKSKENTISNNLTLFKNFESTLANKKQQKCVYTQ